MWVLDWALKTVKNKMQKDKTKKKKKDDKKKHPKSTSGRLVVLPHMKPLQVET